MGCGCLSVGLHACTTAPITDRKQLRLIPESKLNAQAAQLYEKVKQKAKLSDDKESLNKIIEIGSKIEKSISEYFYRNDMEDPTANFEWEYILIDNKKIRNAWCMPGGINFEETEIKNVVKYKVIPIGTKTTIPVIK